MIVTDTAIIGMINEIKSFSFCILEALVKIS
jgi:hypothetical protein